MRLSDAMYLFTSAPEGWRQLSRCREVGIEMVPGNDGKDLSVGASVQLAKQVCASCPVRAECYAEAGAQSGVWGGLTKYERDRLRLTRGPGPRAYHRFSVAKCEECGYECVPPLKRDQRCDDCLPAKAYPRTAYRFKARIKNLLAEGKTYQEIALMCGLRQKLVIKSCRAWEFKSKAAGTKVGSKRDFNMLAPCGTAAARRRHARRGEPVTSCACAQPGSWERERTMKNGWKP